MLDFGSSQLISTGSLLARAQLGLASRREKKTPRITVFTLVFEW